MSSNTEYLKEILEKLIKDDIKNRAERDFYKRNVLSRELIEEVTNLNVEIEKLLGELEST